MCGGILDQNKKHSHLANQSLLKQVGIITVWRQPNMSNKAKFLFLKGDNYMTIPQVCASLFHLILSSLHAFQLIFALTGVSVLVKKGEPRQIWCKMQNISIGHFSIKAFIMQVHDVWDNYLIKIISCIIYMYIWIYNCII